MKVAYFPSYIALNGKDTMECFLESLRLFGFEPVENTMEADAAVVWSVLWNGRLKKNREIFHYYRNQNKPVFVLEVGTLHRGVTWKVALNDITRNGIYANDTLLDSQRPEKLKLNLDTCIPFRRNEILIACQHYRSHQWEGNPSTEDWIDNTIKLIRKHTDRPIIVRPHPRSLFPLKNKPYSVQLPRRTLNSKDFDMEYNYHCVVNYNSGPSVMSVIKGTPVICDNSSLAWPVSSNIENIENLILPDRRDWFLKICHTEWTNEEIRAGVPLKRLINYTKT